jgi:hypothetical protein
MQPKYLFQAKSPLFIYDSSTFVVIIQTYEDIFVGPWMEVAPWSMVL